LLRSRPPQQSQLASLEYVEEQRLTKNITRGKFFLSRFITQAPIAWCKEESIMLVASFIGLTIVLLAFAVLAVFSEPAKMLLVGVTQIANDVKTRSVKKIDMLADDLNEWLSQKAVKTFFGLVAAAGGTWLSITSFNILVACLPIIFPFDTQVHYLASALVVTGAIVGVFSHLTTVSKPARGVLGLIAALVISVQMVCAFQMAAHLVNDRARQQAAVSITDNGAVSIGGQPVSPAASSAKKEPMISAATSEWPLTKETVLAATNAGLCAIGEIAAYYFAARFADAALAHIVFVLPRMAMMIPRISLKLLELVLLLAATIIHCAELLKLWAVRLFVAAGNYFPHETRCMRWMKKIRDRVRARLVATEEKDTLEQRRQGFKLAELRREAELRQEQHKLALESIKLRAEIEQEQHKLAIETIKRKQERAEAKRAARLSLSPGSFLGRIASLFLLPLLISFALFFSGCGSKTTTPVQAALTEDKTAEGNPKEPVPEVKVIRWPFQRPRYVMAILDFTDSFKYLPDAITAVNKILESIGPKDVFVLLEVRSQFDPAKSVVEARLPDLQPEIFVDSVKALDYERKQAQLDAAWKRVAEIRKTIQDHLSKTSATLTREASQVWEPLEYASLRFSKASEYDRVLVVLSDLRHEVPMASAPHHWVKAELPPSQSDASFSGARVEVLFVPYGSAKSFQQKSSAWESWFRQKGARSVAFRDPAQSRLAQPVELSTVPKLLNSPFKQHTSN
jgi:hypothetical protein